MPKIEELVVEPQLTIEAVAKKEVDRLTKAHNELIVRQLEQMDIMHGYLLNFAKIPLNILTSAEATEEQRGDVTRRVKNAQIELIEQLKSSKELTTEFQRVIGSIQTMSALAERHSTQRDIVPPAEH